MRLASYVGWAGVGLGWKDSAGGVEASSVRALGTAKKSRPYSEIYGVPKKTLSIRMT